MWKHISTLVGFTIISVALFSQDIFDKKNSSTFAYQMFEAGDYQCAANEFIGILKNFDNNDSIRSMVVRSLSGLHLYDSAILYLEHEPCLETNSLLRAKHYMLLLVTRKFRTLDRLLSKDSVLSREAVNTLRIYSLLLNNKKNDAVSVIESCEREHISYPSFLGQLPRDKALKYALASAAIPGLGKVLYGKKNDGTMSFLAIGTLAFVSGRAFYMQGLTSLAGFSLGFLALGFYLGNIYGTVKLVRSTPYFILEQIHQDIETILVTH